MHGAPGALPCAREQKRLECDLASPSRKHSSHSQVAFEWVSAGRGSKGDLSVTWRFECASAHVTPKSPSSGRGYKGDLGVTWRARPGLPPCRPLLTAHVRGLSPFRSRGQPRRRPMVGDTWRVRPMRPLFASPSLSPSLLFTHPLPSRHCYSHHQLQLSLLANTSTTTDNMSHMATTPRTGCLK